MKTTKLLAMLALVSCAGLAMSASVALAQQVNTTEPQLAYGVTQIIQLEQAKVSDDTIVAYIKNSGNSYGLTADQIIYLKQQGVSDPVITAMLNQPKPAVIAYTPITPAPQPAASTAVAPVPTATVAPTVTYVQTVPAPAYNYYAQPYYYPSYAWFPPVSLSFGWGGGYYGGWHGGGYYRGGYNGGWHGGGYGGWHH